MQKITYSSIAGDLPLTLLEKTFNILLKYPLCNYCLGRLFARLGRGLRNSERGYALKTLLLMTLPLDRHEDIRDIIKLLAENSGEPFTEVYKILYNEELDRKICVVCGNKLSQKYFEELAKKVEEKIREFNATSFLVGVTISRETMLKELEVVREVGIDYSESLKNEIKREVGKIVRERTGIEPDFSRPDIVVIIDYENDSIRTIVNPVLIVGRYWKKARNISHTAWIVNGVKKYPYSIEEFLNDMLNQIFDSEKVILHASGREDVDARMVGTGRPMVIEVYQPRFRLVDKHLLNEVLKTIVIDAEVYDEATRETIKLLKTDLSKKEKVYKALIVTSKPISESDLKKLEEFFKNRVVRQLTPRRMLRRKKEHERLRKVYEVIVNKISDRVFEALIKSDGGLYIKELVSGDQGRTEPSFSSVLGVEAYCVELDVVGIEVYLSRIQKPLN